MPQFDWLCDVCGCVMSPTSGIYWVDLGFINNYKESQLWLVILRYSADVASAFPWVVTHKVSKAIQMFGNVEEFGLKCYIKYLNVLLQCARWLNFKWGTWLIVAKVLYLSFVLTLYPLEISMGVWSIIRVYILIAE